MTKLEFYVDRAKRYRWRLIARNGRILADSGQGYAGRRECEDGALAAFSEARMGTFKVVKSWTPPRPRGRPRQN